MTAFRYRLRRHSTQLTELKFPLEHSASDLRAAILKWLGIAAEELAGFTLFRRSYDARKPVAIVFNYTLDIEVRNEKALLAWLRGDRQVGPMPDTSYRFVIRAPQGPSSPRCGWRHVKTDPRGINSDA